MNLTEPITNEQDSILKEKVEIQLEAYIVEIENIATNSSDFFSNNFSM